MTNRVLNRERGRRSLCVIFLLLIESLTFSPSVIAEDDPCGSLWDELKRVKDQFSRTWNPSGELIRKEKDLQKQFAEQCPPHTTTEMSMRSAAEVQFAFPFPYETQTDVSVKSGPGSQYPELASLSRGAKVSVAGAKQGWLRIVSKSGKPPGYIPMNAARSVYAPQSEGKRPAQDTASTTEYETMMPVTVRSGPGRHFDELASLSRGAKINVEESSGGWLKIVSKSGKPPGYIPVGYARRVDLIPPAESTRPSPGEAYRRKARAEEHLLAESDGLQAFALRQSGWCEEIVHINARTGAEELPKANSPSFSSLMEKLGQVLEKECPAAKVLGVSAYKGEAIAFHVYRKKEHGWTTDLATVAAASRTPPPSEPQEQSKAPVTAPALSGNAVQDCDAYAAHPDDPERNGARGIEDDSISAEKAIEVCKAAVEQNSQNGRLLFQLGRSYWAGERFEEAVETFLEAGEHGHGGALAYLGDATLYGVAGMDASPEEARKLYQRAAAAGFKPASSLADEIVAGVKAVKMQEEQQAAGGSQKYHYPKTVSSVARGRVEFDGRLSQKEQFVYMLALLAGVQHHCSKVIESPVSFLMKVGQSNLRRFGLEAVAFDQEIQNGVYQTTNQEGVDDGYAFASRSECQSSENRQFVSTIYEYFN